ncbi:RrF2 family transcriptional regulator [Desulfobulbus elongatus]|uniref:RrF2 family transcriptional regulator n=1 Tax=Desulfobulbus elongatus TaxID=53332 RepID=UPI000481BAC2|nr:Rrf2 family transcriptional regulator [Desulfobulbus elongatus]
MRLTRAAEYAIRCVLYLSQQGKGILTSRQEIARQADIPAHFLAKIAQDLAKAGLIEIRQGARGGFVLSKHPAAISLLEVVETMIGEIQLNDCIARPSGCKASYHCAVHRVWLSAREQLRATLRQVSFEQLIAETSCLSAPLEVLLEPEGLDVTGPIRNEVQ